MQIIIVQSEIEQAIRAHIEQQVSIKEGMAIEIDLRSTRGDAGFTANIDIVPAKNTGSQPVKMTAEMEKQTQAQYEASQAANKNTAAKAVGTKAVQEANQGKQEAPVQSAGSTASDQNTVSTETTSTEQAGSDNGEGEGVAALNEAGTPISTEVPAEDPPGEAPKGRSLFPNLKRISNA